MTNTNKKRRSGARPAPAPAEPEPPSAAPAARPGLLSSMFSARGSGTTNMPRVRTSFARGLSLVLSTPALLIGSVVATFLVWLGALAGGFQGPASLLSSALATPPIGTLFDLQLILGVGAGGNSAFLLGLAPSTVVRAVVTGVFLGLSVDVLETGRATMSGARRGLLAAPVIVIVIVIEVGFIFVANVLGSIVGPGLGLFVVVAAVAAALYLFGYAPVSRLREGRGLLESLSRGAAGAKIPGSSALAMALLYTVPAMFLQIPVGGYNVNPSPQVWVFVLFVNILHVAALATYAYRWMCVEDEVPELAGRSRAGRR